MLQLPAVEHVNADQLSEAVVVWTGFGETARPARDEERIVRMYGSEAAATLVPAIRRLEDAFYESDAWRHEASLVQVGHKASDRFVVLHPEISDEAVKALAWCYTYDHR